MSGMPREGLLEGVDLVEDVVDRGLGVGEAVIGVDGVVDEVDVAEEIVDGGMGGEGGEGEVRGCCCVLFWCGC